VDDTSRIGRHLASRLVAARPAIPGLVGIGLVAAGVDVQFGLGYALITAGGLLLVDTLT
jgi:hypothetical protein